MLNQARDLAAIHGYTVLQAVQEWHNWKGASNGMPLGEEIKKFLAAKSSRSPAYTFSWWQMNRFPICTRPGGLEQVLPPNLPKNRAVVGMQSGDAIKLSDDLALLEAHFNAKRPIDGIRSNEIEDFLDSKKATGRRRNNLRSEIITLFRYAQIRLRALHRDRKTEAELVLRDQTKRKPVETFSPEEFDAFLGTVRPEWLPWLALGGLAGIRTDGEIFRITWECFKWEKRIIDLGSGMTKIDERRHVPLCDRLIDLLKPLAAKSPLRPHRHPLSASRAVLAKPVLDGLHHDYRLASCST
jgi:integrase